MTAREAIDRQMRSVLAQLEVISAIPAGRPRTSSGTEHPGGRRPPGDLGHIPFARWYGPPFHYCETCDHAPCAQTDVEREECLKAAKAELKHLRHGTPVSKANLETTEEARERMLHDTVGWSPEQVEQSTWPYTRFQVRRFRLIGGRDAETGVLADDDDDRDPRERARDLDARGMSLRQIGMILRKDKKQVQRYLGRAA